MRGSIMAVVAATALLAGVAGCSLPEVLPLAGGTTAGPSPYGPWYEQHWATNSVLLAAADQPEVEPTDEFGITDDVGADAGADAGTEAPLGEPPPVEANAALGGQAVEFDNSSPYQFPSSSFAPAPVATEPPASAPPPVAAPELKSAPAPAGPIRY